jgi:hypothetical protein
VAHSRKRRGVIRAGLGCLNSFPRMIKWRSAGFRSLERVPIKWNHLIDKDALKIKELEHVLIEKVEQLFRDML